MKPNEVSLTRTYNLGNYENVKVYVSGSVDEKEDPKAALSSLESLVNDWWNGRLSKLQAMKITAGAEKEA